MGNSASSSLAGTVIKVVAAAGGAAALGLGAWSFVSSSSSPPSVDSHGQQIYSQPEPEQEPEDPKPFSDNQSKATNTTTHGQEQQKSAAVNEQVDLQWLEELLPSLLNNFKIHEDWRPHQTLNLNDHQIPRDPKPDPCLQGKGKAKVEEGTPSSQQTVQHQHQKISRRMRKKIEGTTTKFIGKGKAEGEEGTPSSQQTVQHQHQKISRRIRKKIEATITSKGKAKLGEGTPSSQPTVQNQHQQISQRIKKTNKAITARVIKIMSYNIWSPSNIERLERMKAIDQLIQKHSPDIILFQEVSTLTYKNFQICNWWGLYSCSVPPENAIGQFCMMLSKLPVKKFFDKQFTNTTTGRGLYVARIRTGAKRKKLVVATCHLKRPSPPDMNSSQRVSHAKEALKRLHPAPNVVLGGDMNWDDSSDGSFPLVGSWCDAWSTLRPKEDGWTYDTKSNGMINRRWSLQRRLDRFVCKLKDFKMVGIDMIGTEAIPGISYGSNGKKLPVLPSDHYGLILTICPK